ncbi:MAG TPA: hypothetical protein VLB32_08515 [Candidatus Acidoferrales bacterium]|nr:hypothetical protein [Candidatus Acidoferrales bacterium]
MSERTLLVLIGIVVGLTFLGILVDFVFASRDAVSGFLDRLRGKRDTKKSSVRVK